jgi:hypothetical protein
VLVIEPGTRPASRQLVSLRARAVDAHWRLLAPCPHHERCPQPGTGRHPWCHFGFDAAGAPGWLEDLSRRANLNKERASMSFLLIEPPVEEADGEAGADARGVATRGAGSERDVLVVSGAFPVSGDARGRYGCSARGLVLLEEAKPGPDPGPGPGDMVRVTWPDQPRRDGRSGASVVPLPERSGPARPGQALTGQARPSQSGKSRPASPPRKGPPRRGRP